MSLILGPYTRVKMLVPYYDSFNLRFVKRLAIQAFKNNNKGSFKIDLLMQTGRRKLNLNLHKFPIKP